MSIFNLFAKSKAPAIPNQAPCLIADADEVEEPRSLSFLEDDDDDDDWDDDDDDDDD